jgi:hypothetical protein
MSVSGSSYEKSSNIVCGADQAKLDCLFSQIHKVYSSALLNRFPLMPCLNAVLRQVPDMRESVERSFVPAKETRHAGERGAF